MDKFESKFLKTYCDHRERKETRDDRSGHRKSHIIDLHSGGENVENINKKDNCTMKKNLIEIPVYFRD